ncbi:uncharacterized protein BDW47DRAFT_114227 [Aspergillus candidus]|uniref:Transmembrane protein n=1 Tax=Aspergillus candidus TaxID=41067 RepID=A0A2I2EY41_ASPCN|nr:hypothetical protein BDW47DRAFT_114227 [Aspergillus candidus]PLB33295.1 hypothetical protein BDW47DRAFT_114227 [Aspergillus candidus]
MVSNQSPRLFHAQVCFLILISVFAVRFLFLCLLFSFLFFFVFFLFLSPFDSFFPCSFFGVVLDFRSLPSHLALSPLVRQARACVSISGPPRWLSAMRELQSTLIVCVSTGPHEKLAPSLNSQTAVGCEHTNNW